MENIPTIDFAEYQRGGFDAIDQPALVEACEDHGFFLLTNHGLEDVVTNTDHIKEFILGADAKTYNQIKEHIEKQRDKYTQKPITVDATEEEIEAGAAKTYDVPIQFDQSNFFA